MRSLDEIYEHLRNRAFICEQKLDGQRGQLHASKDDDGTVIVAIFSRHLEDMTDKVCNFF